MLEEAMRRSKWVLLQVCLSWLILTTSTGQGEAYGCARREHYGCKRFAFDDLPFHVYLLIRFLAVADAIRTSLGPRGMDKMIQSGKGETIITNDGNTMLKSISVMHPAAKMLVDLSAAQDVEGG